MTRVGFIGVGAMGSRMAANLLRAGHEVTVYDLFPEAARRLTSSGAKTARSPREAAKGSEFVFTMVRDDEASRQVWLDEKNGALGGMEPGATAIESSTVTPAWIRELGSEFSKAGKRLLEAPVSGSTPQAESAQLIFLTGGDLETLKLAEPILKVLGSSVKYAGPFGAGALAKLVTNTLMGVQLATIAEMIGMLKHQGVDPKRVLEAVSATALWSRHLTNDAASMLDAQFETHFPIKLLEKDLGYTVKTAGGDQAVPTVSTVRDLFQKAIDQKLGDLDMTAIVKLFDPQV